MKTPDPLAELKASVKPVTVGLKNAAVRYGDKIVLDHVTVTFDRPEVTVILGPNGAGKSTFLSACAGLLPLSSGTHIRQESDGTLAPITRLGYVLQKPVMFRRSVMDNITMAIHAITGDRASFIRQRDALLALLGIDHLTRKPVHQLSHGERQRLVVARVLLMQPGILMFDEATNSLDQETTHILETQTRNYANEGLPVLWVTHSLDQAKRLADRIIKIEDGKITQDMRASDFLKKS